MTIYLKLIHISLISLSHVPSGTPMHVRAACHKIMVKSKDIQVSTNNKIKIVRTIDVGSTLVFWGFVQVNAEFKK